MKHLYKITQIVKQFDSSLSELEQAELQAWVDQSASNQKEIAFLEKIWNDAQLYEPSVSFDAQKAFNKFKANELPDSPVGADGKSFWIKHLWKLLAGLLLLSAAFVGYQFLQSLNTNSTGHDQIENIALKQGGDVWLGAHSTLVERKEGVELEGKAYFDLAKDQNLSLKINDVQIAAAESSAFSVVENGTNENITIDVEKGSVNLSFLNTFLDRIIAENDLSTSLTEAGSPEYTATSKHGGMTTTNQDGGDNGGINQSDDNSSTHTTSIESLDESDRLSTAELTDGESTSSAASQTGLPNASENNQKNTHDSEHPSDDSPETSSTTQSNITNSKHSTVEQTESLSTTDSTLGKERALSALNVKAGERITISKSGKISKTQLVTRNAFTWKAKTLEFNNTPLSIVIEDLESYYGIDIQTDITNLEECYFTSPKLTNTKMNVVFEILKESHQAIFEKATGSTTIYYLKQANCL